jgi:hypothetical protein
MSARWEPSWRRLLGGTAMAFALVLGLLAIRVQMGADPAAGSDARRPNPPASVAPAAEPRRQPQQVIPSFPRRHDRPWLPRGDGPGGRGDGGFAPPANMQPA